MRRIFFICGVSFENMVYGVSEQRKSWIFPVSVDVPLRLTSIALAKRPGRILAKKLCKRSS
jgi:hypothetical protein